MRPRTVEGPGRTFRAVVEVPGDKSLSHRALIFAALAAGESRVTGLGPGADVASTRRCLETLGVEFRGELVVSPGPEGWRAPESALDAGNSATTLRLMAGVLAGRPFRTTLIGDRSLMGRPMERLVAPLETLGARIRIASGGTPPVTVGGGSRLAGGGVDLPIASAQVRSAVELAALQADGTSRVDSPPGFRDHTERRLVWMGRGRWLSETAFEVVSGPVPPSSYRVPGDPSSAAFLWTAAALRPGAEITVEGVCLNPGRTGFLDVLAAMGANVSIRETGEEQGETTGTVRVRGADLEGTEVSGALAVRTLDELPLVGVLGAAGRGTTRVADAEELRVKETDRIAATVALIGALGGEVEETGDGFLVEGRGGLAGGTVDPGGDHRVAMAAAVAAVATSEPVEVLGPEAAGVSWPGFYDTLERAWASG